MTRIWTGTAKSAKAKIALTLLGVLAIAGGTAYSLAAAGGPDLAVSVSPASQSVAQGRAGSATYVVSAERKKGVGPDIVLTVSGLPAGATATWDGSTASQYTPPKKTPSTTLVIRTPYDAAAGTYDLTVRAVSGNLSNTATAKLVVESLSPFPMSGDLSAPLGLDGPAQPLNISVTNPYDHAVTVSSIHAEVSSTSKTGCGTDNFSVNQLPAAYSVTVAAGSTRTLASLGTGARPTVRWVNLPRPQNACIGATLRFHYTAGGTL